MYLHHANYIWFLIILSILDIKLGTSGLEVSETIPMTPEPTEDSVGVRVGVVVKDPVVLEDRESEFELLE